MKKLRSIVLYTFKAVDDDYIPMILHGLEVRMEDTETGAESTRFLFERYESLDRFKEENLGSIEVLTERHIFMNWDSRMDRTDVGMQMVKSFTIAFDLQDIKPVRTRYEESREFGGSEEGGWYYSNYYPIQEVDQIPDDFERGYVYFEEFYFGQHRKTNREYYS